MASCRHVGATSATSSQHDSERKGRMDEPNTEMDPPIAETELNAIKFDLMSSKDMKKYSSASIAKASDVTRAKLGLPNGAKKCETCGSRSKCDGDGHFGVIKLPTIVFNPYTVEEAVQLLNQICPAATLQRKTDIQRFDHSLTHTHTQREARMQRSDGATSQATCKYCSKDDTKQYPDVIFKTLASPRIRGFKNKPKLQQNPTIMDRISVTAEVVDRVTDKLPQDYWDFLPHRHPSQSNMTKILISPSQVRHILKQLDDPERISRFVSRRELIYMSCLPVTPKFHRVAELPYEFSDGPCFVYGISGMCWYLNYELICLFISRLDVG
uniref:DNA-directed RNA polymerase n=1 Tax=Aegilops tauschii TaxID=37682 RepID=M8BYW7_AEGTA